MTSPRRLRHLPRAAALLGLAACAGRLPGASLGAGPPREYRGHYTSAPGASWFRPCAAPDSAPDSLWVTVTGAAAAQVDSARRAGGLAAGRPAFVRWVAAPTTSGAVGPRGPGAPALLVRTLLEARPAAPGDCAAR